MRVKEFMELYSDSNFHFMTSKGYLFLNSDQVKSILLEGQKEAAKKELGKGIRADELLAGEVISVRWKKGICHTFVVQSRWKRGSVTIKKGDIYYADLMPVIGSEQGGIRPVLIIQNDVGNCYSPTVIVAAITSRPNKHWIPTHIELGNHVRGLHNDSVILLEQVRTIDRIRLRGYVGSLSGAMMRKVDEAILVSFGVTVQRRT